MKNIYQLKNTIQHYEWGDKSALVELFNFENTANLPQAELWIGAHPKAPSMVLCNKQENPLNDLISKCPEAILGNCVAASFNNSMPFLFKILAAAKPLSIQSHPSLEQAKTGFDKENAANIPLNAFNRNYKDNNHKPELICALTPFKALNGFKPVDDIITLLDKLSTPLLSEPLLHFKANPTEQGLKHFYYWMMQLPDEQVAELTQDALDTASINKGDQAFDTLIYLNSFYPKDIGIMCAIMLNTIELQPGEAMYLQAGQLHAYIQGVGVEVMANSDNVLRGGLTSKHIDCEELLSTLSFRSEPIEIIQPQVSASDIESFYVTSAKEFQLSVINMGHNQTADFTTHGVEILFCAQGEGSVSGNNGIMKLKTGQSCLIPGSCQNYTVSGAVKLFKVSVPKLNQFN